MKPLSRVSTKWSPNLAYAIGLITTDGCLYNDGRHINLTSKDTQLLKTFKACLGITNKIGEKRSGFTKLKNCYYLQFGDKNFYNFLLTIGLRPAKSKTIGKLKIPDKYFFDFLRGSFDGDGSFYSYWDKRWASSFLFYLSFISASPRHLEWLRNRINKHTGLIGHFSKRAYSGAFQLKYAKQEASVIFKKMYHSPMVPKLERKFKKIYSALDINNNHNARVL